MVFVTGDCHGNFARFEQKHFSEQANMTKDDTVIITIMSLRSKSGASGSRIPSSMSWLFAPPMVKKR